MILVTVLHSKVPGRLMEVVRLQVLEVVRLQYGGGCDWDHSLHDASHFNEWIIGVLRPS